MEEIIFLQNSKLSPAGKRRPDYPQLPPVTPDNFVVNSFSRGRWLQISKMGDGWFFQGQSHLKSFFLCFIFVLMSPFNVLGTFSLCSIVKLLTILKILHSFFKVFGNILDYIQKFNWTVVTLSGKDSSESPSAFLISSICIHCVTGAVLTHDVMYP